VKQHRKPLARIALAALLSFGMAVSARADSDEDLAKQSQNPVADLISVPFQNNTNFGVGPYDRVQNVLNIQPVIPANVGPVNLINRTILPLVWQPQPLEESGGNFGISDLNHTTWVSPAEASTVVWGVGPVLQLPTAMNDHVGTGQFALGPSAVVVVQPGPFVLGALGNNLWSVANRFDTPYINQLTLQPFINYNIGKTGWYLASAPLMTANWRAANGQQWTVPVGGGFGKVFKLGSQPLNAGVQGYYNAERPSGTAETSLRVVVQMLFPQG
jgi:hypothetical protein